MARKGLLKLRMLVLERDKFRCVLCGKAAPEATLELDHIKPVAEGGSDELSNLRTTCWACNQGRAQLLTIPERPRQRNLSHEADVAVNMPIGPSFYRQQLQAAARALRQEGASLGKISRELGVPPTTISHWLKEPDMPKLSEFQNCQNGLAGSVPRHYLVVQGSVEKFRAPDGLVFPLVIADPPWNISDVGHKRERKVRPNRPFTKDFGPWDAFKSDRAYLAKCRQWLKSLYDVAAPDAWLFFWCSYLYCSGMLREAEKVGWQAHNIYVWAKSNPLPMFGNNNFLQSLELALVLRKGNPKFRFNGKGQPHNFFKSPQVGGLERVKNHDGAAANLAQKPLGLMTLWVWWASRPGDWVLDAFAGTGTTTVAALRAGRHACAVEADPALVHQVEARILRECPGATLYG